MNHMTLTNNNGIEFANVRAEDGFQSPGGWESLRDAVVIPVASLLALVLLVMLVLFLKNTALAHTGAALTTGWMQQIRTLSVREIG